jgi:membrane-associated phospholipid phosphatase
LQIAAPPSVTGEARRSFVDDRKGLFIMDAATPFDRLGAHVLDVATDPWVLAALGAGAGETAALSATRADHDLRLALGRDAAAPGFGDVMVVVGWTAPIALPGAAWVLGLRFDHDPLARAGAAALQAAAITVTLTAALKIATGRPYPLHGGDPNDPARFQHPEYASEWRPFQNGFGAWPSGHASGMFSAAAALTFASGSPWVGVVSFPAAGAVAVGMLVGDHHWTSDVLAGALLGAAIGRNVGLAFARERPPDVAWGPMPVPGGAGFGGWGRF